LFIHKRCFRTTLVILGILIIWIAEDIYVVSRPIPTDIFGLIPVAWVTTLDAYPRVVCAIGNQKVDNKIHLGVALVQIEHYFIEAIVDINDPSGIKLKNLYSNRKDVKFETIKWRDQPWVACINMEFFYNMNTYNSIVSTWNPLSTITTLQITFPAPDRSLWLKKRSYENLEIYHGLDDHCKMLNPTDDNIYFILVDMAPCMVCPISTLV